MRQENHHLAFYFDQSRCMACNTCTIACKDWNGLHPGLVNWRSQFTYEVPQDGFFPLSISCAHCDDPPCAAACDSGAITKNPDGIVSVNRSACMGSGKCLESCPFEAPAIADDRQEPEYNADWKVRHPMQKCTFCSERQGLGESPVCVKACIGRALDFGPVDYILRQYPDAVRLNIADFPYAYKNSAAIDGTLPNIFIKKRGQLTVHISEVYNGKIS